ncbi:hypothetical protein E2P81_ATG07689 [Venturia nashicola]|nr:hypothetical protein E2P81_ATG07689 [Venturia nashicola]
MLDKSGAAAGGPGPMAMHAQQSGMNPMYGHMNPMGAPAVGFNGAAQQPMNQFTARADARKHSKPRP